MTATYWLEVCLEQRKEWISKVLAPSCDLVQRLACGATRRKEAITLVSTDKHVDTTLLRNYGALSSKPERTRTLYPISSPGRR